jgi:hypothetical protein
MRLPILVALTVTASSMGFSANAAELSPWFGSGDQSPFQLDPITMVAVTFAADPLATGSKDKAPCLAAGCLPLPKTAKDETVETGVPQN